jgi:hypothetical protein
MLQTSPWVQPRPLGSEGIAELGEGRGELHRLQREKDSLLRIVERQETESSSATIAQRCWKEFSDLIAE